MPFPYKLSSLSQKIKSSIYGYTEWEEKADIASNSESWGPSTTQLSELASGTFHPSLRNEILRILLKKLKFRPANWRQCHKALVCLEYIIKNGDVSVIPFIKRYAQVIRYLAEHFYYTEGYDDRGKTVRAQASRVVAMLDTSQSIMKERAAAKSIRGKITGMGNQVDTNNFTPNEQDADDILQISSAQDVQEHQDYLFALKLQREEEQKTGRRLKDEFFSRPNFSTRSHAQCNRQSIEKYPSECTRNVEVSANHSRGGYHSVYEDVSDRSQHAVLRPSAHHVAKPAQSAVRPDEDVLFSSVVSNDNAAGSTPAVPSQPAESELRSTPKAAIEEQNNFDFSDLFSNLEFTEKETQSQPVQQQDKNEPPTTSKSAPTGNVEDFF